MDHHCRECFGYGFRIEQSLIAISFVSAWLNNCVGYANHRYFFLYMLYTTVGVLFIIVFGFELGYNVLIVGDGEGWNEIEPLHGHPVRFNLSGHIIPVVCI